MSNTWINPNIIIGNTATGNYYFPRPQIEADIWSEIEKGNHVLIRLASKAFVVQNQLFYPLFHQSDVD